MAFNTIGAVSANRIREIFGSAFGIPLSAGTVNDTVSGFAAGLSRIMTEIRNQVIGSPAAYFDENGTSLNGKLHWAHIASNDRFTYLYLSGKRGKSGMDEGDVLPNFRGIGVHNCRTPIGSTIASMVYAARICFGNSRAYRIITRIRFGPDTFRRSSWK